MPLSNGNRKRAINYIIEKAVDVADLNVNVGLDNKAIMGKLPHFIYEVWETKPNIAVKLYCTALPFLTENFGFSKVNWPDEYDYQFGLDVALGKAAAEFLKEVF